MNLAKRLLILSLPLVLFGWSGLSFADYTIQLKNGRRITVKGFREEGETIKVQGMGGEFGIAKDQIESITKAHPRDGRGMILPKYQRPEERAPMRWQDRGESVRTKTEDVPSKEEEEKEDRRRIQEITERLKSVRDRYSLATRGRTGPEPGLLEGKEAINARTADLKSRMKDAKRKSAALRGAGGATRRVRGPLPSYSAKEKELSELRKEILQLRQDRQELIEEMKQKNFTTSDLSKGD